MAYLSTFQTKANKVHDLDSDGLIWHLNSSGPKHRFFWRFFTFESPHAMSGLRLRVTWLRRVMLNSGNGALPGWLLRFLWIPTYPVGTVSAITLPETSIFAPENGWLEYDRFLLGRLGLFSGDMLYLGSAFRILWIRTPSKNANHPTVNRYTSGSSLGTKTIICFKAPAVSFSEEVY